jgi:hypothetical protein
MMEIIILSVIAIDAADNVRSSNCHSHLIDSPTVVLMGLRRKKPRQHEFQWTATDNLAEFCHAIDNPRQTFKTGTLLNKLLQSHSRAVLFGLIFMERFLHR